MLSSWSGDEGGCSECGPAVLMIRREDGIQGEAEGERRSMTRWTRKPSEVKSASR